MHVYERHIYGMHVYEMHAYERHAHERHAHEIMRMVQTQFMFRGVLVLTILWNAPLCPSLSALLAYSAHVSVLLVCDT
jgi:hypothetical protein